MGVKEAHLPLGPMVTATASAKTFTPFNMSARTSPPNLGVGGGGGGGCGGGGGGGDQEG